MDKNKVPENIQQYTKLIDRKIADIIINTHNKTYRDYCVGDIISIYNVPHKIHRIESAYFSSIEPDGDLVHWGWDEVKDIPINEFWAKQFNFTIIDTSENVLEYEGIVYIKSVNCLAYVFQGEYTSYKAKNVVVQYFNKCTDLTDFLHTFYKLFNFYPHIDLPE
jgi:hypothetical protein